MEDSLKTMLTNLTRGLYLVGAFFVCSGFYKIFLYRNSDFEYSTSKNINTYVGSDAYNYMINSQRATAYFVIAGVAIITATLIHIYMKLDEVKMTITNLDFEVEDDSNEEIQK